MKSLLLVSLALAMAINPVTAQRGRLGLNFGFARLMPQEALATRDDGVDYKLDDGRVTTVAVDYWLTPWLAGRGAYQWGPSGNLSEPTGESFAKLSNVYLAALVAPVAIRSSRPYLLLGGTWRHYEVNAPVPGTQVDVAAEQRRPGAYFALGAPIRLFGTLVAPEAGVLINEFRNRVPCTSCDAKTLQTDLLLSIHLQLR